MIGFFATRLSSRVNHWIAGLSYIYCLITGLAFWAYEHGYVKLQTNLLGI